MYCIVDSRYLSISYIDNILIAVFSAGVYHPTKRSAEG